MANNLTDIYVGVNKNDPNRKKNDFYPTPPLATYILCKYCSPPKNVIEPCAGRGNISKQLERMGHTVKSYDLNEYDNTLTSINTSYDALKLEKQFDFNAVVTNPPYHKDLPRKLAEKWVEEYDYTAMFVRLTFLEGKKRKKLFTNYPPSDIIVLSDRIRFADSESEPIERKDQIGGMIAYMWIVWDKKHPPGLTKMRWVSLDEEYPDFLKTVER